MTTGAGAVFVGNWWGEHHGSVVTVFVTTTATVPASGHANVASTGHSRAAHPRARTSVNEAAHDAGAQADAGLAQIAHVAPAASRHPATSPPASPGATTPGAGTLPPSSGALPTPSGIEPAPTGVITHSPGHPSR